MGWLNIHRCNFPEVTNDRRLGDIWQCDDRICRKQWKLSSANGVRYFRYTGEMGKVGD